MSKAACTHLDQIAVREVPPSVEGWVVGRVEQHGSRFAPFASASQPSVPNAFTCNALVGSSAATTNAAVVVGKRPPNPPGLVEPDRFRGADDDLVLE